MDARQRRFALLSLVNHDANAGRLERRRGQPRPRTHPTNPSNPSIVEPVTRTARRLEKAVGLGSSFPTAGGSGRAPVDRAMSVRDRRSCCPASRARAGLPVPAAGGVDSPTRPPASLSGIDRPLGFVGSWSIHSFVCALVVVAFLICLHVQGSHGTVQPRATPIPSIVVGAQLVAVAALVNVHIRSGLGHAAPREPNSSGPTCQ